MKNLKDNSIDELFSSRFDDFRPEVPASVWDSINRDLNKEKAVRNKQVFFRLSVAASVLLALISIVYFLVDNQEKPLPLAKNNQPATLPAKESKEAPAIVPSTTEIAKAVVIKNHSITTPINIPGPVINQPAMSPETREEKQETIIAAKTPAPDSALVTIAQTIPPIEKENTKPAQKTGQKVVIKNVTDVLTALVNRIDKRDNKIFELNRDKVAGRNDLAINLGFIKIKHNSTFN